MFKINKTSSTRHWRRHRTHPPLLRVEGEGGVGVEEVEAEAAEGKATLEMTFLKK